MPKIKRKAVAKSEVPARPKSPPRPKTVTANKVKAATDSGAASRPVFFYEPEGHHGFLSPWSYSCFTVKDEDYESAGQYVLAEKARAFGDKKARQRILEEHKTEVLISLGENVKGFDEKSWRRRVTRIAKDANLHKFLSDDAESRDRLRQLKNLGEQELTSADASDAILGIGLSAAESTEVERAEWSANIFGKSFDAVRATKAWEEQGASATRMRDLSIFDIGGALSVNW